MTPTTSTAVDAFRDAEREAWRDFERAPSIETRREHVDRLLALWRELDTRAEALLGLAKERRP